MKATNAIIIALILLSCKKQSVVSTALQHVVVVSNSNPIVPGDTVTYLALGDSYTYGPGVGVNETFPYQLAAKLRAGKYIANDPVIIAGQGWTTADLLNNIGAAKITSRFNIVTLLIGVNDENMGIDIKTYSIHLDQLISNAITHTNGKAERVFVISIPDWWLTPFAAGMDTLKIKNDVALFNDISEAEAKRMGARYIDITKLSAQEATDTALTGADRLHPTAKMYALWVNQIYSTLVAGFK